MDEDGDGSFVLEERVIFCDVCRLVVKGKRLCCLDCTASVSMGFMHEHVTFDMCNNGKCVGNHDKGHTLVEGLCSVRPSVCGCLALTLWNRLQCWQFSKFIGEWRGSFVYTTYNQIMQQARSLATFLLRQKKFVKPFIAICGRNSAAWVVSDLAIIFCGGVSVPIDVSVAPEQARTFIERGSVNFVVCQADCVNKFASAQVPTLVWDSHEWQAAVCIAVEEWAPLCIPAKKDELRTLLFTSGSTGTPKCAMLSDNSIQSELLRLQVWRPLRFFCYQPLSYSSARLTLYDVIGNGGIYTMFSGDFSSFFEQLSRTAVSGFSAPPRIWNMLYAIYKAKVAEAPGDSMVASRARQEVLDIFGPNCRSCSTGGAVTAPAVLDWIRDTIFKGTSVRFAEGYGITEVGTIARGGVRSHECKVHLESVPEMGYLVTDKPVPRGLLWVFVPGSMSSGYYQDDENTRANFRDLFGDGRMWFNTGDICLYDKATERLEVIDRAKSFVKLSNALFVSPEHLENIYIENPNVECIWVYASSEDEYVVCIVVPTQRAPNIEKETLLQQFYELGKSKGLLPHEIPRDVFVDGGALWSPETGELTVSLKLNRAGLRRRYAQVIAEMRSRVGIAPTALASKASSFEQAVLSIVPNADFSKRLVDQGVNSTTLVLLLQVLKAGGNGVDLASLHSETLGDLLTGRRQQNHPPFNLEDEIKLPAELEILAKGFQPRHLDQEEAPQTTVFLTGATGFLGAFILQELLSLKRRPLVERVVTLVRASNEEAARTRLLESWKFFIGEDDPLDLTRIHIVCGDLESFDPSLVSGVDVVIHCAAMVSGVMPYSVLRSSNVGGTLKTLQVALQCGCRSYCFVSSLSALGVVGVADGYGLTKRISEGHVEQCRKLGLHAAVVRPGTIGMSAKRGVLSPGDTIYKYMRAIVQMGAAPLLENGERITLCAVEDVAALICDSCEPGTTQSANNIFGPSSFSVADITMAARDAGHSVETVSYQEFLQRLHNTPNELSPLLSYFSRGFPLGEDTGERAKNRNQTTPLTNEDLVRCFHWMHARAIKLV